MTVQGPAKKQQPDGMSHGGFVDDSGWFVPLLMAAAHGPSDVLERPYTIGGGGVPPPRPGPPSPAPLEPPPPPSSPSNV